jgi:ribonuclease BN (tRNA processing enzyme)
MADFYEVDLLKINSANSGDAIAMRYEIDGAQTIHVVDGGFSDTGKELVDHIREHYGDPTRIDHVVVSHPDKDHAAGLVSVLEEFEVGALWMLRPWTYANQLIDNFSRFTSVENLEKRLKEIYPYAATLEEVAEKRGIPIKAPFQGASIGKFTVLAPSQSRFFRLIVESDKTPETSSHTAIAAASVFGKTIEKIMNFVKAAWGEEVFPAEGTSAENEMSVVQYANLCGESIVLTGDAGRDALAEAADYAPFAGLALPGVSRFQIPHHGSRRNVSTEVLDAWLDTRLPQRPSEGDEAFTAAVSAAKDDNDHPRRAVLRAVMHRGGKVHGNMAGTLCMSGGSAPSRNWSSATKLPYPEDQEELT